MHVPAQQKCIPIPVFLMYPYSVTKKNKSIRILGEVKLSQTTTFINVPTVTGHFGMMCKTYTTIIHSDEFTC